jgi:hypothetical protein
MNLEPFLPEITEDKTVSDTSSPNGRGRSGSTVFGWMNNIKRHTAVIVGLSGLVPTATVLAKQPSHSQRQSEKDTKVLYNGEHVYMGIQNLSTESGHLTCEYEGRAITAFLNSYDQAITVIVDGVHIDTHIPVPQDALEPFLHRACAALDNAYTKNDTLVHMRTHSGGRFMFEHDEETYVVNPHDILRLDPAHRAKQSQLDDVKKEISKIEDTQRTDLKVRWLLLEVRQEEVKTHMRAIRDNEYLYSQEWHTWNNRVREFKNAWKNIIGRLKGQNGKSSVSLNEYYNIQRDMEDFLEKWENFLKLEFKGEDRKEFEERMEKIVMEKAEHNVQRTNLEKDLQTRTLHDDSTERVITETTNKDDVSSYTREWTQGENRIRETYNKNLLTTRNTYKDKKRIAQDHYQYFDEGQVSQMREWDTSGNENILKGETHFWRSGQKRQIRDFEQDAVFYYTLSGTHIVTEHHPSDDINRNVVIKIGDKSYVGNYQYEKGKNKDLTPEKYIEMLADILDTPEKFHFFFRCLVKYRYDHSDGHPGGDYWQTPEQTVQDISNGYMRGDCDDYAFLAREILRQQGKNAHVLLIPSHAICVWLEKEEDGTINAYSIGTYGLDTNGNHYGKQFDPTKTDGYKTALISLNSLMAKYKYKGLGLSEGQNYTLREGQIIIGDVPSEGSRSQWVVSSSHFLKDIE